MTLRAALWVGAAGALVLALSVACLIHQGFVGISHDDAARTLIAAEFSRAPSLDPTQSSWLPVPAYLLGTALRVHPSLSLLPQTFSLLAGITACMLAALLARAAGGRAPGTVVSVVWTAAWRWTVVTSASPGVPEMLTVALLLAAAIPLAVPLHRGGRPSAVGAMASGLALAMACGCRYEAWFAAPALVLAYGIVSRDRRGAALLATMALSVPIAWVAINAARHGDPLEFVHRVEAFRRTQGLPPWIARVGLYPRLLATEAGAMIVLAGVGMGMALSHGRGPDAVVRLCAAPAVTIVGALVWTEARGGGATHHPARALLPVVWLLVPAAARGFDRLWSGGRRSRTLAVTAVVALGGTLARGHPRTLSTVDPDAVVAGRAVSRALTRTPGQRWLVDLSRQDFLWVELASGTPDRCVPDRVYGGPAPAETDLRGRLQSVSVAAVSTETLARVATRAGFTLRGRYGPWSVYVR